MSGKRTWIRTRDLFLISGAAWQTERPAGRATHCLSLPRLFEDKTPRVGRELAGPEGVLPGPFDEGLCPALLSL
jgi:hypothetical protein